MSGRPLWRTGIDVLVLAATVAMTVGALRIAGVLETETGNAKPVDGDSLRLAGKDIRLHGIDAPEYRQTCFDAHREWPCGREAFKALRQLVKDGETRCQPVDTDRYGRMVADCVNRGVSINEDMVRQGWAIAYIRHTRKHERLEAEARAAKRGIWRGTFERPDDYRARQGVM